MCRGRGGFETRPYTVRRYRKSCGCRRSMTRLKEFQTKRALRVLRYLRGERSRGPEKVYHTYTLSAISRPMVEVGVGP